MNGNIFGIPKARKTLHGLNIPDSRDNLRRCVQAKAILDSGHVRFIDSNSDWRIFHVASQWARPMADGEVYTVALNGVRHSCTCPDDADPCSHQLACLMAECRHHPRPTEEVIFRDHRMFDGDDAEYVRHRAEN